jgi:hypothetical protein
MKGLMIQTWGIVAAATKGSAAPAALVASLSASGAAWAQCPNPDHDCVTTGTPGCSDADCCSAVCAVDSFCCKVAWDEICVQEAGDLCISLESFHIFGLPNTALGQAELQVDRNSDLVVSNIGSSGQDGVEIGLGEAEGWSADFSDVPDLQAKGVILETSMRGRVDGVDDQLIGLGRFEGTGTEAVLRVDYSNIGSPMSLVRLYDEEGGLLAEFVIENNAPLSVISSSPLAGAAPLSPLEIAMRCGVLKDDFSVLFSLVAQVTAPTGGGVDGVDAVQITALDITSIREFVSSGTLSGANLGSFSVSGEAVQKFGQFHSSLGDALLLAQDDTLTVSNIGSSGQDGVAIDLGGTESFHLDWLPVDPDGTAPPGASLTTEVRGDFNGVENGVVATTSEVKLNANSDIEVSVSFGDLGASGALFQLFNDGEVVAESEAAGKPLPAYAAWTVSVDRDGTWIPNVGYANEISYGGLDPALIALPSQRPEKGDEVVVTPTFGGRIPEGVSTEIRFLLKDFPSISFFQPAPPCPADLNGDGITDGADLGLLLASWNQPGIADLNGDGDTDGADLGLLLASWGSCP